MLRRRLPPCFTLFAILGAPLTLIASLSGCSSPSAEGSGGSGGVLPDAGGPVTVTIHPDADPLMGEPECKVVEVTGIPVPDAHHVATCAPVAYPTNPPSGGPHWPVWTQQGKYTEPVPRELYVHNEEHGWVVLSYRCKDACPDVVAALEKAFDEAGDTYCTAQAGEKPRVILTPDPLLTTPIAASAWGATYTATCIDPKSLADFIARRIGRGTEMICGGGEAPATVVAACAAAGAGSDAGEMGDAGADGG